MILFNSIVLRNKLKDFKIFHMRIKNIYSYIDFLIKSEINFLKK